MRLSLYICAIWIYGIFVFDILRNLLLFKLRMKDDFAFSVLILSNANKKKLVKEEVVFS